MPLPRKLQFKDRFVYHLTRQIEGECEGEPILFPDDTTPIKFVVQMSQNEFTALLSACMTGADLSYPENSHEVVWTLLRQVECPVSICEEILECLQPAFDEINDKLDDISDTVDEISEQVGGNISKPPPEVVETVDSRLCGAAVAVVEFMNATVMEVYAQSESGFFDNVSESVAAILSALPIFGQLPFDEMILLANQYFANQQLDYEADYLTAYNDLVFLLYCRLLENNGLFNYEIWGEWLTEVGDVLAGNRAASVFSRYAAASSTFVNQIAAFIFGQDSFEAFFDEIYLYFLSGAENPSFICAGADCGNWRHTLVEADEGDTLTFVRGGEFDGDILIPTLRNEFGTDFMSIGMEIVFAADVDITQFIINQSAGANIEGAGVVNRFITFYDVSNAIIDTAVLPQQNGAWNVTDDDLIVGVRKIIIEYGFIGTLPVWAWDEVTFAGTGGNPF